MGINNIPHCFIQPVGFHSAQQLEEMHNLSFIVLVAFVSLWTANGFPATSFKKQKRASENDEGDILAAFLGFDVTRDGTVSPSDMKAFWKNFAVDWTDQADENLLAFDMDSDGVLDRQEFRLWFKNGQALSVFMVTDTDEDEFVTRDELQTFIKNWGIANVAIYVDSFDDFDGNGDALWDFPEFVEFFNALKQNEDWMRDEFKALDKDENGLVSPEEYKTASNAVGLGMWAAMTDFMSGMADFNKDGELNFEEYVLGFYG